jgi:alcohol dehydrogenase class IV
MSARLGAVHGFSYTIAAAGHLSHGRSMAVILPHIMRFNLRGNPKRYARVAELMQNHTAGLTPMEGAEMAVEAVERLLDTLNISYRLRDYGIEKEALPGLAEAAMKGAKDGFLPYNPRDFNAVDVKAIFEAAY